MTGPEIVGRAAPREAEERPVSERNKKNGTARSVCMLKTSAGTQLKTRTGFPAQFIRHECDHGGGILI